MTALPFERHDRLLLWVGAIDLDTDTFTVAAYRIFFLVITVHFG